MLVNGRVLINGDHGPKRTSRLRLEIIANLFPSLILDLEPTTSTLIKDPDIPVGFCPGRALLQQIVGCELCGFELSKQLVAVNQQRNWAMVDETDIHHRTELAGGDGQTAGPQEFHKLLIQSIPYLWQRRTNETGSTPLTTVAKQCELTDDEYSARDVLDREVHFVLRVGKYPEPENLLGHVLDIFSVVVIGDPQQNEQPLPDSSDFLFVDGNTGGTDPLDTCAHLVLFFLCCRGLFVP